MRGVKAKLKAYREVFVEAFVGWMAVIGFVFSIFALFSLAVALFRIGLSTIFESFLAFYAGFRQIIFWPISTLLSLNIPETAKDFIIVWSIAGAIAMRALLWFTRVIRERSKEAYDLAIDPDMRRAYIEKFGKKKYDAELAFVEEQIKRTTPPQGGLIFGLVSVAFGMAVGLLGFIYVAIVNPHHETVPISGREFLLISVVVVLLALLAFFALNFLLPSTPATAAAPAT